MIKYVAILVGALVIGLAGGIGFLVVSGRATGTPPAQAGPAAGLEGPEAEAKPAEPLFYKVQTWYEFAPPAPAEALGEPVTDPATGMVMAPPPGLQRVGPEDLAMQSAKRPQSSLRLGELGFDTASIVWMFESEDGKASMVVRSKPHAAAVEPKDYEEIVDRYAKGVRDLLASFGISDVQIEAAFLLGGLAIYSKFVDPGPPQIVNHTVQVLGLPDGNVLTFTFTRNVDELPPDWESLVQASIESLQLGGQPLQ